jgi:DNA (cytosine-5)-methyltransferase 1
MRKLTTVDLFAGAGGITEGFRQAGFQCLFANDFNPFAVETFKLNHPEAEVVCGPIQDIDAAKTMKRLGLSEGELDVLVGGPPCQGFSINAPERFIDDPRNQLFKHYLKFVDAFRPKTLMFENVPGMLSFAGGKIFERVVQEIEKRGYIVEAKVLFAAHYGAPQERWRVIILGTRVGLGIEHPLPTHYLSRRANFKGGSSELVFRLDETIHANLRPPITVKEAIGDLPPAGENDEPMRYDNRVRNLSGFAKEIRNPEGVLYNHRSPKLAAVNLERLKFIKPGGSWRDIPHDLLPEGMKKARRSDHTKRYGRLHPNGLASTIMTKCDPHWGPVFHYELSRSLTVREAARFQTFPDTYRFLGPRVSQYEQVGNAVPCVLARAVAFTIARHLDAHKMAKAI